MPSAKSIKSKNSPPVIAHVEFFAAALTLAEESIEYQLGLNRKGELFCLAKNVIRGAPAPASFWVYAGGRRADVFMDQLVAMGFERVEPCDYGPFAVRYV